MQMKISFFHLCFNSCRAAEENVTAEAAPAAKDAKNNTVEAMNEKGKR